MLGDKPSTAIEECCDCYEPTGRAGSADDSLYCEQCDSGPFCPRCYDDHTADNPLAQFECKAKAFYRETHMLAPGKDVPAARGHDDYEARVEAWREWCKNRMEKTQ